MNQIDQNINKDMIDSDLIDVESLDYSDNQTWLYTIPGDSGNKVDIVDWKLSCDWPVNEDDEYQKLEKDLFATLDNILKNEIYSMADKQKFDSRTYVRPKRRPQRPSIQSIVEGSSNPPSISPNSSLYASSNSSNKYLTYNKYSMPLGPVSPMLRLKTFNVDVNTDNSSSVKEYAMKRRSLVQDDDPQLEDLEAAEDDRLADHAPMKPINIDLSQPAHNLHNTFNKGLTNILNERGSLPMDQSGEMLMHISPPSLVNSLMESTGTIAPESLESRRYPSHRDSGPPTIGRESIDPMMNSILDLNDLNTSFRSQTRVKGECADAMLTSMTLSILDERDMSSSFLSQTTCPGRDSLDSLPPSLISSGNSSYVVSNSSNPNADSNIFSSATFTHLEQTERLLSSRPRACLYNSLKRESPMPRNSESYTKSKEQAVQIDATKILNENCDKKDTPKTTPKSPEMTETITLHYSNNKFRRDNDAEKENVNASFQEDDAFFKDMGMQKNVELSRNSLNVTLDKQELNEIIQARQKLSLARKALPSEPHVPQTSPTKIIQLPNQTITVPRQSMENASELLSRRRLNGGFDRHEEPTRETPKRNATFKKTSPGPPAMDTTVVYVKDQPIIDINSATMNLIDSNERTLSQEEWGSQERAMVGSSDSTDTGTLSSASPPASAPDCERDARLQVASTPLMSLRKGSKNDLLASTISPIYDMVDDKSYTLTKVPSPNSGLERTYDMHNTTVVNSATLIKKPAKRDILAPKCASQGSQPRRIPPTNAGSYTAMAPPSNVPRKTNLPTSKLRQYSSHRELSRIPAGNPSGLVRPSTAKTMIRRNVYASNPALSPTSSVAPPIRRDSYTVTTDTQKDKDKPKPDSATTAPPALVRQGTETLRRERPLSQLVQPRDVRAPAPAPGLAVRSTPLPPPTSRPYSVAGSSNLRVPQSRPGSVPVNKPAPASVSVTEPRPQSSEQRVSALPRPSRLPPRRALRPPSVYSVAPTADVDHY